MKFETFVGHLEKMEPVSGKLELADLAKNLFMDCDPEEIYNITYLMQGEFVPNFKGINLNVSAKSLLKIFDDQTDAAKRFKETGDLGLVAEEKFPTVSYSNTVNEVHESLLSIADMTGSGSQERKAEFIRNILKEAGGKNAKWMMRMLAKKMRLGGSTGTIIKGLSAAFLNGDASSKKLVESAYYSGSEIGKTAFIAATEGKAGLKKMTIEPFKPVMPMLANKARTIEEAFKKTEGTMHIEVKLDGERVQIHSDGERVEIFSRSGEYITKHYPDVKAHLENTTDRSFIIEGEAIAMNGEDMLPFQELMHRKRDTGIEEMVKKYPVKINLFDVLYIDGKSYIDHSYLERNRVLEDEFPEDSMVNHIKRIRIENPAHLKEVLFKAIGEGAEGLMIKAGDGKYVAGARANAWLKLKREYMEGGADTFDLVVVGAENGEGKRANAYGSLLLAAKKDDHLSVVTKVGTGFKDADLEEFKSILKSREIPEIHPNVSSNIKADVWFDPEIVIEVSTFEITKSQTYEGGYGIRFPRFVRRRPDRDVTNASNLEEIKKSKATQVKKDKE